MNQIQVSEKAIAKYEGFNLAEIDELVKEYMQITVPEGDKEAFEIARKALTVCVKTRTGIDKRRKRLGEDLRAELNEINDAGKFLVAAIAPAEDHLSTEWGRENDRLKAIKEAEAAKEQARIQGMLDELTKYDSSLPVMAVSAMTDEEYTKVLADAKASHEAKMAAEAEAKRLEEERLAKEASERQAENERLEKMRKEQEADLAKIKAEQERLIAEQEKIAAEKRRIEEDRANHRFSVLKELGFYRDGFSGERILFVDPEFEYKTLPRNWADIVSLSDNVFNDFIAELKKQLAEFGTYKNMKAEEDAKERSRIEAEAKLEAERKAKEDEARRIAMMPDKEALLGFGQFLTEGITYPAVKSEEALEAVGHIRSEIGRLSRWLVGIAEEL